MSQLTTDTQSLRIGFWSFGVRGNVTGRVSLCPSKTGMIQYRAIKGCMNSCCVINCHMIKYYVITCYQIP